jgi:hypothetical protein
MVYESRTQYSFVSTGGLTPRLRKTKRVTDDDIYIITIN